MVLVKALLRLISYVFHGLFCLGLIALSSLAFVAGGGQSLRLGMLPWTGSTLLTVLFFGSLIGLLTLVLALRGSLKWLFFLWSLVVAVMLIKSYFLSGYRFAPGEAKTALYLMLSSVAAVFGSWFAMTRRTYR